MTCVVSLKELIEGLDIVGDEMHVYLNKTNGEKYFINALGRIED
jgi:hypothetical protein